MFLKGRCRGRFSGGAQEPIEAERSGIGFEISANLMSIVICGGVQFKTCNDCSMISSSSSVARATEFCPVIEEEPLTVPVGAIRRDVVERLMPLLNPPPASTSRRGQIDTGASEESPNRFVEIGLHILPIQDDSQVLDERIGVHFECPREELRRFGRFPSDDHGVCPQPDIATLDPRPW